MNGNEFALHVVTPEGTFLKADVSMIEFPSQTGELGILAGHMPMLVDLAAGELRVYRNGDADCYAVAGGYVQVLPQLVRVVASFAENGAPETDIDVACARARNALETAAAEDPALVAVELQNLKAELLRLAQRRPRQRGKS